MCALSECIRNMQMIQCFNPIKSLMRILHVWLKRLKNWNVTKETLFSTHTINVAELWSNQKSGNSPISTSHHFSEFSPLLEKNLPSPAPLSDSIFGRSYPHASFNNRGGFFWVIFCPFTPLKIRKITILKKWKQMLEICSFYTSVLKNTIIWGPVPEIQSERDQKICHFVPFSSF